MAFSIKADKADRLARKLARLAGESMTTAVTVAIEERIERLEARRDDDMPARVMALADGLKWADRSPVSKVEWDGLWGEGG